MQLTPREKEQIYAILDGIGMDVIVFGSRAKNTARPDSDLDLCLKNGSHPVPLAQMAKLREAFQSSSLPFIVDLVDYGNLNALFQQKVDEDGVKLR